MHSSCYDICFSFLVKNIIVRHNCMRYESHENLGVPKVEENGNGEKLLKTLHKGMTISCR